jgi:lysophospholipid acyltransferase (LPLAT)-like uncharacterized protein
VSKSILDSIKVYILGCVGLLFLAVLFLTYRIKWRELENQSNKNSHDFVFNKPAKIISFWHGRQLLIPLVYWSHRSKIKNVVQALISLHSDGRLIAFIVGLLGVKNIAGSSSRGGKEATLTLIERLKLGDSVALTPDGPKGPISKSKPGILKLAATTGAPIYPLSYSANKFWRFKSWDKMILPKPFARVEVVVGRKMIVTEQLSDGNIDRLLNEVDERLNEAEREADAAWS